MLVVPFPLSPPQALTLQSVLAPILEAHRIQYLTAARSLESPADLAYHAGRYKRCFSDAQINRLPRIRCCTLFIFSMLGCGSCEKGRGGRNENEDENENDDRELIVQTTESLTKAGNSIGNSVAKQEVQGSDFDDEDRRGDCARREERRSAGDAGGGNPYAKIVGSYVGVITIAPGEYDNSRDFKVDEVVEMQVQRHSAPFSFSLESIQNHNDNPDHEEVRLQIWESNHCNANTHKNKNTRCENTEPFREAGEVGEAREVLVDTQGQGQRQIQVGWTLNDFDWAGNLTMEIEDDWAWLNGGGLEFWGGQAWGVVIVIVGGRGKEVVISGGGLRGSI
ncbi:uncharacterized protein EAF01_000393 [Botrytis porri]|uniref:uncharacterized protein n=1 Tax=Botrytis porri TaxID=87229 RepID=UPI0019014612|nr:uncharacterized protein EAF01_000393 [Botrytis porri]KAF7913987.1 hypothetical protein EAF01_000393 [Botrytis porri]